MFRDYQINLGNTANLNSSPLRGSGGGGEGSIQDIWEGGKTLHGGNLAFYRGT